MRASSSSDRSLTFWPLSQYSPAVGVSRQPMRFMSVDFPDPEGPMMATNSLRRIWMSMQRVRGHHGALGVREVHARSEEHTSELQSRLHLVCRLLLEKKKKT